MLSRKAACSIMSYISEKEVCKVIMLEIGSSLMEIYQLNSSYKHYLSNMYNYKGQR